MSHVCVPEQEEREAEAAAKKADKQREKESKAEAKKQKKARQVRPPKNLLLTESDRSDRLGPTCMITVLACEKGSGSN
jgi:hypothetical protein